MSTGLSNPPFNRSTTLSALVIVPEPRLRAMFSLLLTDAGAEVGFANDPEQALRELSARFCRVAVVAEGAVGDTASFLGRARIQAPGTKFLLVATRDEVDGILPLFSKGLHDALVQPLNAKRAVAALQRLLAPEPGGAAEASAAQASGAGAGQARGRYLTTRSGAMRRVMQELWSARSDPIGVILRGEAGVEFELAAREFHALGGEGAGALVPINARDLQVEALGRRVALDALDEGMRRTYFVHEVEQLPRDQEEPLLDFLRQERRSRDREKPLRIVFALPSSEQGTGHPQNEFFEELQFIVPTVIALPPLRDRREDIAAVVERMLLEYTALFPECRARAVHPAASEWLATRNWRGNYLELLSVVRKALMEATQVELPAASFGKTSDRGPRAADAEERAADKVLEAARRASGT